MQYTRTIPNSMVKPRDWWQGTVTQHLKFLLWYKLFSEVFYHDKKLPVTPNFSNV